MKKLRKLTSLLCFLFVGFWAGCGASKEELRLSSELAASREHVAAVIKDAASQKEGADKSAAKLSAEIDQLKTEAKTTAGVIDRLQADVARLEKDLKTRNEEVQRLQEELKKAAEQKNVPMRKLVASIKKLNANLLQRTAIDQMKPLIAEASGALDDLVASGEIADENFAKIAKRTLSAISDYVRIDEVKLFNERRGNEIGRIGQMYLLEDQPGWEIVSDWNYPSDRIKPFNEVMPGYVPALTQKCVVNLDMQSWIYAEISKNIALLTALVNPKKQ